MDVVNIVVIMNLNVNVRSNVGIAFYIGRTEFEHTTFFSHFTTDSLKHVISISLGFKHYLLVGWGFR